MKLKSKNGPKTPKTKIRNAAFVALKTLKFKHLLFMQLYFASPVEGAVLNISIYLDVLFLFIAASYIDLQVCWHRLMIVCYHKLHATVKYGEVLAQGYISIRDGFQVLRT